MRRRITTAIVGVTAFVLLALGIPLAIIAERQLLDSEVVELQAAAAETLTEIALPIDTNELADIASEPDSPPPFAVYGLDGTLLFGRGPKIAEPAVDAALRGDSSSSTDGLIVVATPITDKNETVVGALRLSESLAGAQSRARRAWLVMAGAGVAALAIAWLIGSRIAKGLSRPLIELAALATRMGNGGVIDNHPPVGITEIDLLGTALVESSHRVTESLSRERRFSADVSHQLRTPLTGLRLKLEAAATNEQNQTLAMTTLDDLDRIDSTVAHLLAFARDAVPPSSTSSLQDTVMAAKQRFDPRATATERTLVVTGTVNDHVQASASSIEQVLDVLLDNALDHGQGQITMTLRAIAGGAAIDINDEGALSDDVDDETLFRRGHGHNNGIGLALARSLAEAEGGRLLLIRRQPTTFSLVLLSAS